MDDGTLLLASCLDHLKLLVWMNTKEAQSNSGRPKSIVEAILGTQEEPENMAFTGPEEYEEYRKQIIERRKNG